MTGSLVRVGPPRAHLSCSVSLTADARPDTLLTVLIRSSIATGFRTSVVPDGMAEAAALRNSPGGAACFVVRLALDPPEPVAGADKP